MIDLSNHKDIIDLVMLFQTGNPTFQWLWFSGGLAAVMFVSHTTTSQERFCENAGKRP